MVCDTASLLERKGGVGVGGAEAKRLSPHPARLRLAALPIKGRVTEAIGGASADAKRRSA
jgi:hypothetical protein